jgi:hypothetical protein
MKAALLIAAALAFMAPAVFAANITLCYVTVPVSGFVVTAAGKITIGSGKPVSIKQSKGSGDGKFIVAWKPIASTNGTVCSTTVDKKDSALADAWASARVVGFGFSPLTSSSIAGSKTTGNTAKQYDFSIDDLTYEMGSGALGAKVNQKKPILLNQFSAFSDGSLTGTVGGANVTIDLTTYQSKTPIKGCKLQLATKTSEVIVKCTSLKFTQISGGSATGTSGNDTATLTKGKITFAKAPQGAIAFSSANSSTLPDVA